MPSSRTLEEVVRDLELQRENAIRILEGERNQLLNFQLELKRFEDRVAAGYGSRYQKQEESEIKQNVDSSQESVDEESALVDSLELALSKIRKS